MKKKFFLATGAFLAACTMVPSFTSCDEDTKKEIIGNLIDQAIGYISRDSTDYLAGTWVSADPASGVYDTLRFGKMTAAPATYGTLHLGYSGTYSDHYATKDEDYVEKGVYSYIKSMKEVLIYTTTTVAYKSEGQTFAKPVEFGDTCLYEYGAQVMKLNLTSDYNMHQLTLTEYENGKEVGATQYTYVDETK